jgi:hypothetical protein
MSAKAATIVIAGLMVLGLAILDRPRQTVPTAGDEQTEPLSTRQGFRPPLPGPPMVATAPAAESSVDLSRPTNLIARLLNGDDSFKLSPQQLESYLQGNRRSAGSLLGAFRTTEDPAFLREAMEKSPDDPRVNFAAYFAMTRLPEAPVEDRRQRLETFKQSAPDNALPNYLSAQEHFKSGQTDQAVMELVAASGKSKFQDCSGDFIQNAEEAYRAAGYSEAEAKTIAACSLPLPQLAQLQRLGQEVVELATLYRQAGDETSAQTAVQMGLNLAQRVGEPSGNHFLINDLAGLKVERQILESVDPASPYANAGHTVQDRLHQLAQRQEEIKRLGESGDPAPGGSGGGQPDVLVALSERMPPQDLISFFDRIKVSGEMEALRWALNKLGAQR